MGQGSQQAGEIFIDNVNISTLELGELRRQLVTIPQQPFLFSGSVRDNLDPAGYCNTVRLEEAVRRSVK